MSIHPCGVENMHNSFEFTGKHVRYINTSIHDLKLCPQISGYLWIRGLFDTSGNLNSSSWINSLNSRVFCNKTGLLDSYIGLLLARQTQPCYPINLKKRRHSDLIGEGFLKGPISEKFSIFLSDLPHYDKCNNFSSQIYSSLCDLPGLLRIFYTTPSNLFWM